MKSIKIRFIFLLFVFTVGNAFSQDDFYSQIVIEHSVNVYSDSVDVAPTPINNYSTKADYYQKEDLKNGENSNVDGDESYCGINGHQCNEKTNCSEKGEVFIDVANVLSVFVEFTFVMLSFCQ